MSTQDKIDNATLADARKWSETDESFTFCVDYLGISAHSRLADEYVSRLETRFEKLLEQEDRKKHPTNIDTVTDLMTFSNYGPLAQLFVIDALTKWSDKIAACKPEEVDTPFINGEAWVGVAKEIQAKLAAAYARGR